MIPELKYVLFHECGHLDSSTLSSPECSRCPIYPRSPCSISLRGLPAAFLPFGNDTNSQILQDTVHAMNCFFQIHSEKNAAITLLIIFCRLPTLLRIAIPY
ncbi:hypothetical protein TNCV_4785491 [Trichonephila clavipes]|nr:hypothetical protein TNCV_4785491 [Trichonephila clavipes]